MKSLYILRHAKAVHPSYDTTDFARTLNAAGMEDATQLGAHMQAEGLIPEHVLCSPSTRTEQTLAAINTRLPTPLSAEFVDKLYLASSGDLVSLIQPLSERHNRVMIVGHNPGLQQLCLWLTKHTDPAVQDIMLKFPTCSLAVIDMEIASWQDVNAQCGTMRTYVSRHDLAA